MPFDATDISLSVLKIAIVLGVLLSVTPIMVWVERRGSALIQDRVGPNRVGPFGLLQSFADALKFILKEDVIPAKAHKVLYTLAPMFGLLPAVTTFAVIPWGRAFIIPEMTLAGWTLFEGGRLFEPIVADVSVGILLIFALVSLGVYGIVTLMSAGLLRLVDVVNSQAGYFVLFDMIKIPAWNMFPMFIGFVVFTVSGFAETNRLPFDLPEAEAELVAGYHTEYSSMKFAMFFMAEYMAMFTMAALITTLFLGGWDVPWYDEPPTFLGFALSVLAFATKVGFLLFVFVWVRWTLPRFKYDQLMRLGWKVFLPLAILNIIIVALLIAFQWI